MPTRLQLGMPVALVVSRFRFSRLRRVRPRIFGYVPPGPMPMMLSEDGWYHGKLTEAALYYGRVLDVAAPLVKVTTYLDGDDGPHSLEAEVARRERQDAAILRQDWEEIEGEAEDWDEDAASRLAVSNEDLDIVVNGAQRTVSVTCYKQYRAFRFQDASPTARVVSRQSLGELPRFEIVTDLEPYFRGLTLFMLSVLKGPSAPTPGG